MAWLIMFVLIGDRIGMSAFASLAVVTAPALLITFVVLTFVFAVVGAHEEKKSRRAQENRVAAVREHFRRNPSHVAVLQRTYERTVYVDEFGDIQVGAFLKKLKEYVAGKTPSGNDEDPPLEEVSDYLFAQWATEAPANEVQPKPKVGGKVRGEYKLGTGDLSLSRGAGSRQDSGLQVSCWSCKHSLEVTPLNRGTKVRCPQCGTCQYLPR